MLDAFVSNRMRQAAAEAGQARPRQAPGTDIASGKTRNDRHDADMPRSFASAGAASVRLVRPGGKANAPAWRRPLRPKPSARYSCRSIPASSMRRSRRFSSAATWKASGLPATSTGRSVEFSCLRTPHCLLQEGIAGRRDARPYISSERFELDLENKGNPLAVQLASATRFARDSWQRSAAFIGKMMEAAKRRLKDF